MNCYIVPLLNEPGLGYFVQGKNQDDAIEQVKKIMPIPFSLGKPELLSKELWLKWGKDYCNYYKAEDTE